MRNGKKALITTGVVATALGVFAASRWVGRHPVGNLLVPEPAKPVDLKRYLGRWYEIARYDQLFERGCEAATADYSLGGDGRINVVNRCRKSDGRMKEARGIAKIVDDESNAKLKVSFFRPFYGDYWVLDHADDYSWSIVGEPSGRYLWLLARKPLQGAEVEDLVSRASALGYDTSLLVFDRH